MRRAAKCVIEHLFDNHTLCSTKWCKPLRDEIKKKEMNTLPLPSTSNPLPSVPAAIAGQEYRPPSPSSPAPSTGLHSPKSYEFKRPVNKE